MTPLEQPLIIPVSDDYYRVVQDYVYAWSKRGLGYRITVRRGFTYDGASVPRVAWTITGIRPDGLIRAAALVHDWLYEYEGLLPEGSHQYLGDDGQWHNVYGRWNRRDADRLFGRIMREAGVARWRRRLAYRAVRLFGWIYWP